MGSQPEGVMEDILLPVVMAVVITLAALAMAKILQGN
jgi:hypothetical protein